MKKHPPQNRTNVQIKGGGVKGLLNNVQKTCTFLKRRLPLKRITLQDAECWQCGDNFYSKFKPPAIQTTHFKVN